MAERRAEDHFSIARKVPLHDEHLRLGARMTEFAGWRMPLIYSSIIDEHFQVRCRAGLFDVSHMGRILLRGPGAVPTMRRLVATDISTLAVGKANYTVLLTPTGGIQDDLIVYRREDGILLVVNAGPGAGDREWIEYNLLPETELDDLTELTCLFALQGPEALAALRGIADTQVPHLATFTFGCAQVAGVEATVMRTGYTGEQGVEIMVAAEDTLVLWRAILAADGPGTVEPCGLGARDTLRLEAALPLYGRDITRTTDPFAARLGWLVDLDRPDFVGREALLKLKRRGPERLLAGLVTHEHVIPRTGDEILAGKEVVGRITSGSLSPILGHPIALGYLRPALAQPGTEVSFLSRGRRVSATVVDRPFYRRGETRLPPRPVHQRRAES